jgi:lysophospholipase L1-like esterase
MVPWREKRAGRIAVNVALALASVLVTLVACETAARVWFWRKARADLHRMMEDRTQGTIDTPASVLAPGIRPSAVPEIVYELKPNLTGTYDGRRYATNRFGFRQAADTTLEKPEGVLRIFGIGDSWMWGTGVDNGETYLDRLQELFDAEQPGKAQVQNAGVWGYNAVQEVATLEWKGLLFSPDVVVIGLCGNDLALPPFMTDPAYLSPRRSFLWSELRRRLHPPGPGAFIDNAYDFGENPRPEYRHLAGFDAFFQAYAHLSELAERQGLRVVVFSECLTPDGELPSYCHLGTPEQWKRWKQANAQRWGFRECGYDLDEIPQNYPGYGHATAEGNRRLARILYDCIVHPATLIRVPVTSPSLASEGAWPPEAASTGWLVWTKDRADFIIGGLVAGHAYRIALDIIDSGGRSRITLGSGDRTDVVDLRGPRRVAWPRRLTASDDGKLRLSIQVAPWRPSDIVPGSADQRLLGVAVSEFVLLEAAAP